MDEDACSAVDLGWGMEELRDAIEAMAGSACSGCNVGTWRKMTVRAIVCGEGDSLCRFLCVDLSVERRQSDVWNEKRPGKKVGGVVRREGEGGKWAPSQTIVAHIPHAKMRRV